MNIPYQELQAAGVDLAAVVSEEFLNDFSTAHFKHVPAIYSGKQRFTNFDNDIEIAYQFTQPIQITLKAIPLTKFKRLWHSHLMAKGAPGLQLSDIVAPPSNLSLTAQKIKFTITCYQGHTGTVVLTIDFVWNLEGRCAVTLSNGILTLEPIKLEFSPSSKQLEALIQKKLAKFSKENNGEHCGEIGGPPPDWCAKAEQFILFLLNTVLSVQMTNFVRSWTLPNAIQLFDGVNFIPGYLSIHDGQLVLGGQVSSAPVGLSPIQQQIDGLVQGFRQQVNQEFANADDEFIKRWDPHKSSSLRWLDQFVKDLDRQSHSLKRTRRSASPTVGLCSNDRLFDILAKKYLSANTSWNGGSSIDHIVKADIGWWFRVDNAAGKVIKGGIEVTANVAVGGSISLCTFDLDPKHFGDWLCAGISVELVPLPNPPGFDLRGYPDFAADGVYVRADLLTQAIGLQVPGWPGWANDILGWVTGMLTFPLLAAIRAVISLLHIRIAQYPANFPGTGLAWTPNMSNQPDNQGPYLVFLAAPTFN